MGKSSFGLVGSALAFHAGGPGSIPGRGALVYFRFNLGYYWGEGGRTTNPWVRDNLVAAVVAGVSQVVIDMTHRYF